MADVVAVEQHGVVTRRVQPLLHQIGDRRFAGARKPRQPENRRLLMLERRPLGLADQEGLPREIGAAPQPESHHAGANRVVGEAVDNDERSGPPVLHRKGRTRPEHWSRHCRTPRSFNPSVCAARCSRVLGSILYLSVVIVVGTVLVPIRARYERPGTSGSSLIQMTCAANWSETSGRADGLTRISPRARSTSSVSVSVTASPASADTSDPSKVTISLMLEARPEVATTTGSPTAIFPETTVPA